MTATDPTSSQPGFPRGDIEEGPVPQRFAGSTLPDTTETTEAVADRGARHIEMDGGAR